jgi:hypothetical protein
MRERIVMMIASPNPTSADSAVYPAFSCQINDEMCGVGQTFDAFRFRFRIAFFALRRFSGGRVRSSRPARPFV